MGREDATEDARRRRARRESSTPIVIITIAVLALVGGGIAVAFVLRPSSSSSAATPSCSQLRDALLRIYAMNPPSNEGPFSHEHMRKTFGPRLADASIKRCSEDKWSPDVVTCYLTAKTWDAFSACFYRLTSAQQQRLVTDTSPEALGMAEEPRATASSHPDPGCATAVSAAIDGFVASGSTLAKDMPAERRARIAEHTTKIAPLMKTAITRVCSDDKWAPEVIACVGKARSDVDLGVCAGHLPALAKAHFDRAVVEAVGIPEVVP
jgi:hypothetical protein